MTKPARFASAVSLVALATVVAGCATQQQRAVSSSGFGGQADGKVGLAMRALAALNAKNYPAAIDFAERAVENTPSDAGFRSLLGNAYFAAGRLGSAEAAYKDSLTIYAGQPQVVLKLALAQIALGKTDEAARLLNSAQSLLDPADRGLALALAGFPGDAIPVLESAARVPNASPRLRQNLALAHALAGDWRQARVIASQDVPANELDARIQEWMALAKPKKASDQVAALTGVVPAASDPGQPVRLALRTEPTRTAKTVPAPQPQPQEVAAATTPPPYAEPQILSASASASVPAAPAPSFAPPPSEPAAIAAPPPPPIAEVRELEPAVPEFVAASAPEAVYSAPVATPVAKPVKAKAAAQRVQARKASLPLGAGKSDAVVQLGSYRSPDQVSAGWATLTKRYPALRAYLPMRARFDSPKGTFWRLSIQGFGSQREAIARCQLLRSRGGSCFVRHVAGDAPVHIASR